MSVSSYEGQEFDISFAMPRASGVAGAHLGGSASSDKAPVDT